MPEKWSGIFFLASLVSPSQVPKWAPSFDGEVVMEALKPINAIRFHRHVRRFFINNHRGQPSGVGGHAEAVVGMPEGGDQAFVAWDFADAGQAVRE